MTDADTVTARLFFEDLSPGDSWSLPPFSLDADEIIESRRRWDPQPLHADPVAARATPFGGLIASGVHTVAAPVRAEYDGLLSRIAVVAGVGFDTLRFRAPVSLGRSGLVLGPRPKPTRRGLSEPQSAGVRAVAPSAGSSGSRCSAQSSS